MKTGQMHQTFIYIFVVIVVGVLLIIGYQAIINIMMQGCEVEKTTFVGDLKTRLDNSRAENTRINDAMGAPCNYEEICFAHSDKTIAETSEVMNKDSVIKNNVNEETGFNVFLRRKGETEAILQMENMEILSDGSVYGDITYDGIICIPTQGGKFYLSTYSEGWGILKVKHFN